MAIKPLGPAVVSVPEAAIILGISRAHGFALARRGVLPVVALGRRVVVPRRALEEMLATSWADIAGRSGDAERVP